MARKHRSPGGQLKGFGETTPAAEPQQVFPQARPRELSGKHIRLANRLQMLNLVLFTSAAIMGYILYFVHKQPAGQS
ncbi:MAG: hypothetical protein CVV27_18755, partial [Candidatus Melainabacteria bacterium HGW-Melainabacteria-1]